MQLGICNFSKWHTTAHLLLKFKTLTILNATSMRSNRGSQRLLQEYEMVSHFAGQFGTFLQSKTYSPYDSAVILYSACYSNE
jgi:hypothetical protein